MIAKLTVWGANRKAAIERLGRALHEYRVRGIQTSIPFFKALIEDPDFCSGNYNTGFISDEKLDSLELEPQPNDIVTVAAAILALEKDLTIQDHSESTSNSPQARWKWSFR
jgi:acetyl/propionyl-CoA carboxylase alpha subunit